MSTTKSFADIEKIARNIDLDKITPLTFTKLIRSSFGLTLSESVLIARFIICIFVTNKNGYRDEYMSLRDCMTPSLEGINLESMDIRSLSSHFLKYSLLNGKSSLLLATNVLEGYRLGKIRGQIMRK